MAATTETTTAPTTVTEPAAPVTEKTVASSAAKTPARSSKAPEAPIPAAVAVAAVSAVDADTLADLLVGKNICPNDLMANTALESALATLRNADPVTPEAIANAQTTLYNVIARFLVRKEEADAFAFLTNLLVYIEHNLEVHFTSKLKFRCVNMLDSLNTAQRNEFNILLSILIDTAPLATRASTVKAISWKVIHGELVPAHAELVMSRMMKFYNVQ